MAFDKNPLNTPADRLIAGNTAEEIVRTVAAGKPVAALGRNKVAEPVSPAELLTALIARYDRKAASREEAA